MENGEIKSLYGARERNVMGRIDRISQRKQQIDNKQRLVLSHAEFGQHFYPDGVHLTPSGIQVFTALVVQTINS